MKENERTILDNFTGGIGDFIVYKHFEKRCLRRKPRKYRDARSTGQRLVRGRMSAATALYRSLKDTFIRIIWKKAAEGKGMSGFNLFVGAHMPAFDEEGVIQDFSKLCMSEGTLHLPDGVELSCRGGDSVSLCWTCGTENLNERSDDELLVLGLYSNEYFVFETADTKGVCRKDGTCYFRLSPEIGKSSIAHLYVFFRSADRERYSKAKYFHIPGIRISVENRNGSWIKIFYRMPDRSGIR